MKKELRSFIYTICAVSIFFLSACSPSTRMTASWTNPEAKTNYNNILIAAMTENVNTKQMIEDALAEELSAKGINVSKSIDLFPPNFTEDMMNDKDALLQAIRENGHDAILSVVLIDEETETRYVPGNAAYAPMSRFNYYGNFWGYYSNWYPQIYNSGYYAEDKVYFLESNLYNANTENLVWSGQSESVNPASLQSFSGNFAEITVNEMINENLLQSATN